MRIRRRRISRKAGLKKGVYLLPNLCTTASLFCGFFAIIKSLSGDFAIAAWAVLLAGVFDLFDGQLARLTKGSSQFGIEYDSLTDLTSFGMAPAILIYMWGLNDFKRVGWIVSFLFFACGALRLARYNVQADLEERKYFQGLPIPMAAYVLVTTILFYESKYALPPKYDIWVLFLVLSLALLMVSTVRYRSAKQLDLKGHHRSFFALVGAVAVIGLAAWKPPVMMMILALVYVVSGPLETLIRGRRWEDAPSVGQTPPKRGETGEPKVHFLQKRTPDR